MRGLRFEPGGCRAKMGEQNQMREHLNVFQPGCLLRVQFKGAGNTSQERENMNSRGIPYEFTEKKE